MVATSEREIDGFRFSVTQLTAMKALRMLNRIGRIAGSALAKLSGAGELGNVKVDALGEAVALLFDKLSDDELEAITRELLATATMNGAPLMPQFDMALQGKMDTVLKLLKFALEVNYGNFFHALGAFAPGARAFQSAGSSISASAGSPTA